MYSITTLTNDEKANARTITSIEVAEMVGKPHNDLLKDIRRYCEQFNEGNISPVAESKIALGDFWIESTYLDAKRESRPCYLVTKKGCEFIAHKMTGVKGTVFTARYINRFHDMEDYIKEDNIKSLPISLKEQVQSLEAVAEMLHMNDASKLLMLENFYKEYDIPTGFLPKYEHNDSRQLKSLTNLLKENGCAVSAVKFNQKLVESGYIQEMERPSSKGNGTKKFKALTESGLKYGENAVSPHNQREVQPLYYADTFMELYRAVKTRK